MLTKRIMSDIVIGQPAQQGAFAQQLMLLLHGYGADASDLTPLGRTLAKAFPAACVVSLEAPDFGEQGFGRQWYSLLGVDDALLEGEASRAHRVAQALPALAERIAHWQASAGVGHEATLLLGFSQGASMALAFAGSEFGQRTPPARVVSLSGRMVSRPRQLPEATTVHWIHGKMDDVIAYAHCVEASEHLLNIGADLTTDILPHTGHEISAQVQRTLLQRLQTYIPKRLWREALSQDPSSQNQG